MTDKLHTDRVKPVVEGRLRRRLDPSVRLLGYLFIVMVTPYDPTAGWVETPGGPGRFVEYDSCRQTVTVEQDNEFLVEYPAGECYVPRRDGSETHQAPGERSEI